MASRLPWAARPKAAGRRIGGRAAALRPAARPSLRPESGVGPYRRWPHSSEGSEVFDQAPTVPGRTNLADARAPERSAVPWTRGRRDRGTDSALTRWHAPPLVGAALPPSRRAVQWSGPLHRIRFRDREDLLWRCARRRGGPLSRAPGHRRAAPTIGRFADHAGVGRPGGHAQRIIEPPPGMSALGGAAPVDRTPWPRDIDHGIRPCMSFPQGNMRPYRRLRHRSPAPDRARTWSESVVRRRVNPFPVCCRRPASCDPSGQARRTEHARASRSRRIPFLRSARSCQTFGTRK